VKLRLIVITGPRNSGKTALATCFELRGYKVKNVGNLLAEQLERAGLLPYSRSALGAAYLRVFGMDRYCGTVVEAADPGVVLDGLRLPQALSALRRSHPDLVHIARPRYDGPAAVVDASPEPYAAEISQLESTARHLIAWRRSVHELPSVVTEILGEEESI